MSRYNRKVDKNQSAIVKALKKVGATVADLSGVGEGVPDLLVIFRDQLFLLEVKNPDQYWSLTEAQKKLHANANGLITIVETREEALKAIGAIS